MGVSAMKNVGKRAVIRDQKNASVLCLPFLKALIARMDWRFVLNVYRPRLGRKPLKKFILVQIRLVIDRVVGIDGRLASPLQGERPGEQFDLNQLINIPVIAITHISAPMARLKRPGILRSQRTIRPRGTCRVDFWNSDVSPFIGRNTACACCFCWFSVRLDGTPQSV